MTINMFDTRSMLRLLAQMLPVRTFLLDMFFTETEFSNTAYVDIDIIKGKRKMAPFVSPMAEGKMIERDGYTTKSFAPPYIKPKWITSAADILKRDPGNHVYAGNASPAQRAMEMLSKDLAEADKMITRREEWMAAQALNTGSIVVTGDGVSATIDFGMKASHKITLTGNSLWTDSASTPLEDLRTWRDLVAQSSGFVPNVGVFGQSVINALLAHADFQNQLNTRRIDLGSIDPQFLAEQGVVYYGHIKDVGLDIYGYMEWYDLDGTEYPMVPVDKIFLGSTGARTARHYGAIQDLEFSGGASVRLFPKSWMEKDPSGQVLLVQSAPLVVPHQIDAFASIKAV